jgi:hypothetical protein
VGFASDAYQLISAQFVTQANLQDIKNAVNRPNADGCTLLSKALETIGPILNNIVDELGTAGLTCRVEDLNPILVLATDGEPNDGYMPNVEQICRLRIPAITLFTLGNSCNAEPLYTVLKAALGEQNVVYKSCNSDDEIMQMADSVTNCTPVVYSTIEITTSATLVLPMATSMQMEDNTGTRVQFSNIRSGTTLVCPFTYSDDSNIICTITGTLPTGEVVEINSPNIGSALEIEDEGIKRYFLSKLLNASIEELDELINLLDSSGCQYPSADMLRLKIAEKRADIVLRQSSTIVRQYTIEERNATLEDTNLVSSGRVSSRSASSSISTAVSRRCSQETSLDAVAEHDDADADPDADADANADFDANADADADFDANAL